MQVMFHRLELFVLDFDNYGIENIESNIKNLDGVYKVGEHQTTVIPEWIDNQELNKVKCTLETMRKYFDTKQVGSYVDIPLRKKTELESENEKLHEENRMLKNKLNRIKNTIGQELKGL